MKYTSLVIALFACIGAPQLSYAEPVPPAPLSTAISDVQFAPFEGVYEFAPEFKIKVWRESGRFMAQGTGQGAFEIFPESQDTFFAKSTPLKIVFKRDPSTADKVTHFILVQGGREQIAKKTN